MSENDRELDFLVGDLQREIASLREEIRVARDANLALRHALQHIYAKATLALEPQEVVEHDDKASY